MSLTDLLKRISRPAVFGLALAVSPAYSCGGEESSKACVSDTECKGEDRVCADGQCVYRDGKGDSGSSEDGKKEYSCSESQDCNELVAATLFYSCATCCLEPSSSSNENFYREFNETMVSECVLRKEGNIQNSNFMRECLETGQLSKKLLSCWCRASESLSANSEGYEAFPQSWQECRSQYDR